MAINERFSVADLLEVKLTSPQSFPVVIETLTRIGLASETSNILHQIVFLLHKKGRYYLAHYKELEALDGFPSEIRSGDINRRNTVARLLSDWELIKILSPERSMSEANDLTVVRFTQKGRWTLRPKYIIGSTSSRSEDHTRARNKSKHQRR